MKYLLDTAGRPIIVQKDIESTSIYSDDSNSGNSNKDNSVEYFRFYYSPQNSFSIATLSSDRGNAADSIRLRSIDTFKLNQSSQDIASERVYFGNGEPQNDLHPSGGSVIHLKSTGSQKSSVISHFIPYDFQPTTENQLIPTNTLEESTIEIIKSKKSGALLKAINKRTGEKISGNSTTKQQKNKFLFSANAKGDPASPSTENGSYLTKATLNTELSIHKASTDAVSNWIANDFITHGNHFFYGGGITGYLAARSAKLNPLNLRLISSHSDSASSNGDESRERWQVNLDPVTGQYTSGSHEYYNKFSGSQNSPDLPTAGTTTNTLNFTTAFSDQNGLASANLISVSEASQIRSQLDALVTSAANISSQYSLTDWGGTNKFLFTEVI